MANSRIGHKKTMNLLVLLLTYCLLGTLWAPLRCDAENESLLLLKRAQKAVGDTCRKLKQVYLFPGLSEPCRFHPGCEKGVDKTNWVCNSSYGRDVSCNCSGLRISTGHAITLFPEEPSNFFNKTCFLASIESELGQIGVKQDLLSLYVGFQSGIHTSWPSRDWTRVLNADNCYESSDKCTSYNPTQRPWFQMAVKASKNVIILWDVSGSMSSTELGGSENAFTYSKRILAALLDSFWEGDYFGIVGFDSSIHVPPLLAMNGSTFQLVPANQQNIRNISSWINTINLNMEPTDFQTPFQMAFNSQLLFQSTTINSACQNVILIVSDGMTGDGKNDLYNFVTSKPMNSLIFNFEINTFSQPPLSPLSRISCYSQGLPILLKYSPDPSINFGIDISSYTNYFSSDEESFFVDSFTECCGMGEVTACVTPCYDTLKGNLIGVVGSSIPLSLIPDIPISTLLSLNPLRCAVVSTNISRDLCLYSPSSQVLPGSTDAEIAGIIVITCVIVLIIVPMILWCARKICFSGKNEVSVANVEKQLEKTLENLEEQPKEANDNDNVALDSTIPEDDDSSSSSGNANIF